MDKKKIGIIIAVVVVILAIGAGVWFFVLRDDGQEAGDAESVADQAATAQQAVADSAPTGSAQKDVGNPDISLDTSVYGTGDTNGLSGMPLGEDEPDEVETGVEDIDSELDEQDIDSEDTNESQADELESDDEDFGIRAPDVNRSDNTDRPDSAVDMADQGDSEDQTDDLDSQEIEGEQLDESITAVRTDGIPCTFLKAVYSRDKKKCLVSVSLPSGKALSDPSGYELVVKTDDNGHKPGKGVIYCSSQRSELCVYMNSAYFFGPGAAFAIVPTGSAESVTVPADCYVELPYGATYTGSRVLDGSQADFRDMMSLLFADSATVDTWVSSRQSKTLQSLGTLTGSVEGSSQLQLGTVINTPVSSVEPVVEPTVEPEVTQEMPVEIQPDIYDGTQLGPDGEGTSAASY